MNFFDYFQVASLAIFLFILIGKILYLRLSRNVNPIAIGGGKKGLVLAFELISFAGLIVWMVEVLLYASHSALRIFPSLLDVQLVSSAPAKLIGVALASLGLAIFAMAYVSFGDSWRVGFDVKSPGALVTTGIFSISRNPIYLFLDLWFIGIFLINGTLIFLIFAALAVAAIHWQIRQEETFLANLYGQPYQDYCGRTGRYVMRWRKPLVVLVGVVFILLLTVKSDPFAYTGYCQHVSRETWTPGNIYPCTFWHYVFTSNSSDFTLYLNTPGG